MCTLFLCGAIFICNDICFLSLKNIEGKEERGKEERMSPGAGSAKVVLYAILRYGSWLV